MTFYSSFHLQISKNGGFSMQMFGFSKFSLSFIIIHCNRLYLYQCFMISLFFMLWICSAYISLFFQFWMFSAYIFALRRSMKSFSPLVPLLAYQLCALSIPFLHT